MDGFGSDFSAGGSSGKVDTGTIMEQVKVQIALANAQELLQVNQWERKLKPVRTSQSSDVKGDIKTQRGPDVLEAAFLNPAIVLHEDNGSNITEISLRFIKLADDETWH